VRAKGQNLVKSYRDLYFWR